MVADGSNSRFGRALGTWRDRSYPQGMAIRGYYESPMHDDPWIESALDVRDRNGASLPGYGWIFPVGNGTINVGVGLLSTFRDWKSLAVALALPAIILVAYARLDLSVIPASGRNPDALILVISTAFPVLLVASTSMVAERRMGTFGRLARSPASIFHVVASKTISRPQRSKT